MAENAGTIYYDVDINTQGVIDAQRSVRNSSNRIAKDLGLAENATQGLSAEFKRVKSALDPAFASLVAVEAQIADVTTEFKAGRISLAEYQATVQKLGQVAVASSEKLKGSNGLAVLGRKAGAAGIQIQQFIGQIQGGQNAAAALSAQAADLGIVLGAPLIGSIVGIAAAFGGPFISALFGADEALDAVRQRIDDVRNSANIVKTKDLEAAIAIQEKTAKAASDELERLAESGITVGKSFERAIFNAEKEEQALESLRFELGKVKAETSAFAEESNKAYQDRAAAQERSVDEYLANLERELAMRETFARQTIAQTQRQFQDEQALADEQLQVRLAAIDEARKQQLDIGQSYDQAEYEARAMHAERLAALDEQRTNAEKAEAARRLQAKQAEVNAYAQLGGQLSNLVSTIGAEQSALGKAIFLANQALAVANIIVSTQQAAAQALTLDPTGALSARVTAIGYASAGIAAGVAVGETFAGRQTGGPVQAGSAYRVNEAGAEGYKFSSAGREYIQMLGGNGEIVPADQIGGSGGGVTININNAPGIGASAQSSDDGKYITIDTFRTDMAENGPMSRSMTGAFSGLKRRTE